MITIFISVIMGGSLGCFLEMSVSEELEGVARLNFPGALPSGPLLYAAVRISSGSTPESTVFLATFGTVTTN